MLKSNKTSTIFTVTEIVNQAKSLLEQAFSTIWVEGEVSNLKQHSSGHWYLTLKDASSQLRSAMFRGSNRLVRFNVEDGLKVRALGRLSLYPSRGDFQMVIDVMEPAGLGALQLAYEQLKKRLDDEGLFDGAHKQELPPYPSKIAVITSPTGAAIQDILNVIGRRSPLTDVDIYPVHVQGEQAAQEIAHAINRLNEMNQWDAIICGRGGGSLEDLWAFNEEIVARAIAASKIPIISAVGHEIDYTIADFVADVRAETPTAAAEMVVRDQREIKSTLLNLEQRLNYLITNMLEGYQQRLDKMVTASVLEKPLRIFEIVAQRVDDLALRIKTTMSHQLTFKKRSLYGLIAQLNALSPLNVMARGYALVYKMPDKQIVKTMDQVNLGDELEIKLVHGSLRAKTIATNE